ncbi:MAG TPA: hypothetical protein VF530_00200 [Planctomycetota bacterium]
MRPPLLIGLVLVFGLFLGAGLLLFRRAGAARAADDQARLVAEERAQEAALRTRLAPASGPEVDEGSTPASDARSEVRSTLRTEPGDESAELITEALREHARQGFARGWAELRDDPVPDTSVTALLAEFESTILALPETMGKRSAEKQSALDRQTRALAQADAVAWLEGLPTNEPELAAVARDPERFARLFRPRSSGGAVNGVALEDDDPLVDGTVIAFPAGVFAVADFARSRDPVPRDVTVRGAGMDATLLVMDDLGPRGALERLTFEDCTVYTANCGVIDIRGGPTSLTLRRMRVVGFDCGAGGSLAFDTRACAILAQHSRFESGYGTNPNGYANLLRAGGAVAARFEACTFERLDLADAARPGVVFLGCAMVDLLSEPRPGPLYQDCTISVLPAELRWDEATRKRDLNELFPDWRERLERR